MGGGLGHIVLLVVPKPSVFTWARLG